MRGFLFVESDSPLLTPKLNLFVLLNCTYRETILGSELPAKLEVSKLSVAVKSVVGRSAVNNEYRMGLRTLPCKTSDWIGGRVFCTPRNFLWKYRSVRYDCRMTYCG